MKKTTKLFALAGITLLSASVLAACGAKSSSSSSEQNLSFPSEVKQDGTAVADAQLKYAFVSATTSSGLLIDELTENTTDSTFGGMVDISMFGYDGDRKLDDSGLAKAEFDVKGKKITVSLTGKDYKWSDGEPFTINDYIFTIKSMASKDYTGVRFDDRFLNIVGMDEFVAGTASDISGLKKIDDYTVELTVKEMSPSMMYAGGDVPAYIQPEHIYKDIPVADWEKSEYSRTAKLVGMGPWKIKEIVNGESITYVPNEYFFKGTTPKTSSLKIDIVSPDTIVSEMKAGNYDIADMPVDQLDSYKDASNLNIVGSLDSAYEYISFNFGKYDESAKKNVMDENAKMNDVKLRQAIAYAIDTKTAGESLYNGLYHPANSLIISFFGDIHDSELEGYSYDPEKAKKLLEEAGYKDVDGDGIREGKDGKEFKITFAARKRTEANEALVQQYIAWWKEVGLNVELYTGRTVEGKSFYNSVQANDATIDMYAGGWSTGYDPNPTGLWGPIAAFNMSRFVSDENTKLLNAISSTESFDDKKNVENYKAWQKYAHEQAFAIPTFESESITALNKRVKNYDSNYGSASGKGIALENIELTADKGVVAE
ncbi:oligopeptide ABC transporter substrate-binding protein [Streptococcus suis]|uniref:oligopeptide ABC transporter substrate-binding protein n=1 Tax=Streptococcus suis TaxID=1307 RepID=UPI000F644846|nr:oligopeptide ABC transporter substrate-binding protein [Streptococcus suis]RRR51126.1 oligopeptide ABC transporter substrate-binding protein [Streptococcus suis]HEL1708326.1 oligopeptide ABC transporter substrate-binding protein [Streptococcus suis]HEL1776294.1 oligopeptide ABC transporter substrate-binding protein [Streptococcus suis]HEL2514211.1 oligopeptide ABC transporter substrate-binding protein [Streptococcus suis]HEP1791985.1 oligopeptide ABC transporter substrate-binding protein [S